METIFLTIDDLTDGIQRISLVDAPAIQEHFIALKEQKILLRDEAEHIIYSPALIPDQLILRRDETGEYYIAFSKDAIEKIAARLLATGCASKVDEMHNHQEIDGIYPIALFIKNSKLMKVEHFEDLPDGTLMVAYRVTDSELWDKIGDDFKGISIEGTFSPEVNEKEEAEALLRKIKNLK